MAAMETTPQTQGLSSVARDQGFVREWRQLRSATDASFFLTPEWTLAWWRWTGEPATRVAYWRCPAGRLVAVACLSEVAERVHPAVPLKTRALINTGSGAGSADHHGWLATPASAALVWEWILNQGSHSSIVLRALPPKVWQAAPAGFSCIASSRCPRASLSAAPARQSGQFRSQLNKYQRRLLQRGLEFRRLERDELTSGHLEQLFRLHDSRRSLNGGQTHFHLRQRDLLRQLSEDCQESPIGPVAVQAWDRSECIGMLYGFVTESTFAGFQSGWKCEWAKYNIGTVLIAKAMEWATEAGLETFDFLRGPENYKYRFGAHDVIDRTLLLPTGLSGKLLRLKNKAKVILSG